MIAALLLAALGAAASPRPSDDIDRFISICIDGGKPLLDESGVILDSKDVPKQLARLFGKPGDSGASALQYFLVGEGEGEVVVIFEQSNRRSDIIRSACTLVSAKFGTVSARQALLERLGERGIEDVTTERFVVGDPNVNGFERAYQNPVVNDMLARHAQITRFTLQTADPNFEVFGRQLVNNLYALSVLKLSEKDARDAKRAWDKCQKAGCSLPQ